MRLPHPFGLTVRYVFLWSLLSASPLNAEDPSPQMKDILAGWRGELPLLRLNENDITLSPGWKRPFQTPSIEALFSKPLQTPATAAVWLDQVESAATPGEFLNIGIDVLFENLPDRHSRMSQSGIQDLQPPHGSPTKTFGDDNTPLSLRTAVSIFSAAVADAQPLLEKAVNSVTKAERDGFLSLNEWPVDSSGTIKDVVSTRRIRALYAGMNNFDQKALAEAATALFAGVDRALPLLTQAAFESSTPINERRYVTIPQGRVLIGGHTDDVYEETDLENVIILIDFGGRNTYQAPVAAAFEGEIRVVIDFGENVIIDTADSGRPSAGSGVFGIGLLVLPNERGVKQIYSDSFSQGCGLAGVGALLISGEFELKADRYAQGAGVFGVGILGAANADHSTYTLTRMGQGLGMVRGVGLFRHSGNGALIRGGLVEPDPRETKGAISLGQGVGYGHRSYVGGGVGLAAVRGNKNTLQASYFAQGVGYWHSLGAFRLRGNENLTQARRYNLGSGVHSAFGLFHLIGDKNRILNWGVGPNYAWDQSFASAIISGNENEVQAEWGTGCAAIGGFSFGWWEGNNNRLQLPNFGNGFFERNLIAYSVQCVRGKGNRVKFSVDQQEIEAPMRQVLSPWGLAKWEGTAFDSKLRFDLPVWPQPAREVIRQRQYVNLRQQILDADLKSSQERVADLLDAAATFSVDKESPRLALRKLLMLPPEDIPCLIEILDPVSVEEIINLQIAVPAHGEIAARAILAAADRGSEEKRATLAFFLGRHRPTLVLPKLLALADPERATNVATSIRLAAVRILCSLMNRDMGREPGMRAGLTLLYDHLSSRRRKGAQKPPFEGMKFADGVGLLAIAMNLTGEQRGAIMDTLPEDITTSITEDARKQFLQWLSHDKAATLERVRKEERALEEAEPVVRRRLYELIKSSQANEALIGVIGLGQVGGAADAERLESLLQHERAAVREAAAIALARLGEEGLAALARASQSDDVRTRGLALASVPHASTDKSLSLLKTFFSDNDPFLRLTVAAIIADHLPPILQPQRKKLISQFKKRLKTESDSSARLAVQALK